MADTNVLDNLKPMSQFILEIFGQVQTDQNSNENKRETCVDILRTSYTPEIRLAIEEATKNQSNSEDWYSFRDYRITASRVSSLRTARDSQIKERFTKEKRVATARRIANELSGYNRQIAANKESSGVFPEQLKWGKDHEPIAREKYIEKLETDGHINVQVYVPGLVIDPMIPIFGCSPDGIVTCSCHPEKRLLEIKCPYSCSKASWMKGEVKLPFFDNKNTLKTDHMYYYQITQSMAVLSLNQTDFVVWSPNDQLCVSTVPFDEQKWEETRQKTLDYYFDTLIPEFLEIINRDELETELRAMKI